MTVVQNELPPVKAAAALAPMSIKETVLAQFKEAETDLTAMAERYRNVVYDVTTPKGMKDAKEARADLRDNGRLLVTRAEKRIKADVNELKTVMSEAVDRLVGIVRPVEEAIDAQIKAEETRKAEAKAERERIEAERIAKHRANIDKLKSYAARAEGQPVENIEKAMATLSALQFGEEWEEFAAEASGARDSTVEAMRKMVEGIKQRAENERLAAELAQMKAALAAREQEDAVARQQAEAARLEAERERIRAEEAAKLQAQAAIEAAAKTEAPSASPEPVSESKAPEAVIQQAQVAHVNEAANGDDTLTLGQINALIAPLKVDAAGLEQLGFMPSKTVKAAKHYPAHKLPAMVQAMATHLQGVLATA